MSKFKSLFGGKKKEKASGNSDDMGDENVQDTENGEISEDDSAENENLTENSEADDKEESEKESEVVYSE